MNILILLSYGSLRTIADFYNDIFHGHATEANIEASIRHYESIGMTDPLGANTNRIGRAMIKRLEKETGEHWKFFIANHYAQPAIKNNYETVCSS